ncbi:MAG: hypothetical protein ACPGVD_03600 [Flavobacteriales bacterium]
MKNLFLIAATALLLVSGCKKGEELTKFDISYSSEFTVPATSTVSTPYDFYTPEITSDYKEKFEKYRTASDKVESIKLKSLTVSITDPTGSSLKFMKSLEVYIEADGKGEERIAWKMDIPETVGESMKIELSDTDLKPFIISDQFKMRARATNDEAISVDHKINIEGTFEVDAKLL